MNNSEHKITIKEVLEVVENRQPIQNIESIDNDQLAITVCGIGNLTQATSDELSFISNASYASDLPSTNAALVFVTDDYVDSAPVTCVAAVVQSPYLAYATASQLFDPSNASIHGRATSNIKSNHIHPTAQIANSAVLGENIRIGAFSVIDEYAQIGNNTVIESHVHIGNQAVLGEGCVIKPYVNIAHNCELGNHVRIHAHASIGSEGFGFAPTSNPATEGWERIVQLGRVVIGNNVRIGSQTCVDRGAIEDTVIEDNVIIDNLVQIAHNVRIGAGTAIAANTGIAGSTTIGKRCIIAGAVGIVGHVTIADDVTLTCMSMVTKSITKAGSYSSGTTAMPTVDWRRAAIKFRKLGRK